MMSKVIAVLLVLIATNTRVMAAAPYDDTWGAEVTLPVGCSPVSFPVPGTITMVIHDGVIAGENQFGNRDRVWNSHVEQDGTIKAGTLVATFTGAGFEGAFVTATGHCTVPVHFVRLLPGAYDGNWTGQMVSKVAAIHCDVPVSVKIDRARLTGTTKVVLSVMPVYGIVAPNGTFLGTMGGFRFTGRFDGSSFEGLVNFREGGGTTCGGTWKVTLTR